MSDAPTSVLRVGTIDCETLALETDAVVYEVAVIEGIVHNRRYDTFEKVAEHTWHLPVLEQVAAGRRITEDTLNFQKRILGPNYETVIATAGGITDLTVSQVLQQIKDVCWPLDELWIQKASFDYSVLHSLAEQHQLFGGLWKHKAELDLRPMWRLFDLPRPEVKLQHRALSDCEYNVEILKTIGRFMLLDVVPRESRRVIANPVISR